MLRRFNEFNVDSMDKDLPKHPELMTRKECMFLG